MVNETLADCSRMALCVTHHTATAQPPQVGQKLCSHEKEPLSTMAWQKRAKDISQRTRNPPCPDICYGSDPGISAWHCPVNPSRASSSFWHPAGTKGFSLPAEQKSIGHMSDAQNGKSYGVLQTQYAASTRTHWRCRESGWAAEIEPTVILPTRACGHGKSNHKS